MPKLTGTSNWSPDIDETELNCSKGGIWTKSSEEKAVRDCGNLILNSQLKEKRETGKRCISIWPWVLILAIVGLSLIRGCNPAWAETGKASYFTNIETGGRNCADGKYHNLNAELVVASWRYPIGSYINVSNNRGVSVICKCVDRGPGRKDGTSRFYKGKRIIDLSAMAFRKLAPLSAGVITVSVEEI
jgi:hypothetical protein